MENLWEEIKKYKYVIIASIVIVIIIIVVSTQTKQKFTNPQPAIQNVSGKKKKYIEKILSLKPKIIYIENFITPEQAKHLIEFADKNKRPSTIDTKDDPYTLINNIRSSESAHLGKGRDKICTEIEMNACNYVGLEYRHLEPMQVVVYEKGQKFNPHYDFFGQDSQDLDNKGNRNKTILVYLNDIPAEEGGATSFVKLGLKIQPKAYSAIYFENMNESGVDYDTLHAGEELKSDKLKKYAINIWFREKPSW